MTAWPWTARAPSVALKAAADATEELKENPTRVVPSQERHVQYLEGSRFTPIAGGSRSAGIVLLKDNEPGKECQIVSIPVTTEAPANTEPPPPEPFEFNSNLD